MLSLSASTYSILFSAVALAWVVSVTFKALGLDVYSASYSSPVEGCLI